MEGILGRGLRERRGNNQNCEESKKKWGTWKWGEVSVVSIEGKREKFGMLKTRT